MIEGAHPPSPKLLPDSIKAICDLKFLEVRLDKNFDSDVDELVTYCIGEKDAGSRLRTIWLPELDEDTIFTIRVLGVAAAYLKNLFLRISRNEVNVFETFVTDSSRLLAADSILNDWLNYFGHRPSSEQLEPGSSDDSTHLPVLVKEVERIIGFCYNNMTEQDWTNMSSQLANEVSTGSLPSREEMAAMSATGLLSDEFAFIRRRERTRNTWKDPLSFLQSLNRTVIDYNWYQVYVTHVSNPVKPITERILCFAKKGFGRQCHREPSFQ